MGETLDDLRRRSDWKREAALQDERQDREGVEDILELSYRRIPPPPIKDVEHTRALIFDSSYDNFRGVVTYVRVFEGAIRPGDKVRFMKTGRDYEVTELGCFTPKMTPVDSLGAGEVGYIIAAIKEIASVKVGDTVTLATNPAPHPLRATASPSRSSSRGCSRRSRTTSTNWPPRSKRST